MFNNTPPLLVREAWSEDLPTLISIWLERPGANPSNDLRNLDDYRRDFALRLSAPHQTFKFWLAEQEGSGLGWSSLQRMRNSPSLRGTMAEWSIYVTSSFRSKGVGRALAQTTIEHAVQSELEWVVGFIAEDNASCLTLFESMNFTRLGTFPRPKHNPERPKVHIYALDVSSGNQVGNAAGHPDLPADLRTN